MCTFRQHLVVFVIANGALNTINLTVGRSWWAFWPLLVTGLAVAIHYLVFKAATVDEHWAEERTQELNLKSYDRGHIENIREHIDDYEKQAGRR